MRSRQEIEDTVENSNVSDSDADDAQQRYANNYAAAQLEVMLDLRTTMLEILFEVRGIAKG